MSESVTGLDAVRALASKRLIFTVSTGRSGTNFLAEALATLPGVRSVHEPVPQFQVMRDGPEIARRFLLQAKLPKIAAVPEGVYIETSHMFCKGYFEPLLELGLVPDLILLRRDPRAVATSLFHLRKEPGRRSGAKFYLRPDDPGVMPLPDWKNLHPYQRCYWYCLEIDRRAAAYGAQARAAGARVVAAKLEEIRRPGPFLAMVDALELPRPAMDEQELTAFLASPRNTKENRKSFLRRLQIDYLMNLDELEADVRRRCGIGEQP